MVASIQMLGQNLKARHDGFLATHSLFIIKSPRHSEPDKSF